MSENGAVGIDIGSQFSVIGVVKKGGVETVLNQASNRKTPTVVSVGNQERMMGELGFQQAKSNWKGTISGFNRFLGMKTTNPNFEEEKKFVTSKVLELENQNIGFEIRYKGELKVYTPEQMMAMYLQSLKTIYEKSDIYCTDMVLSVPPYFTQAERQAFIDATEIANINCLKLINETTAIGLGYGLFRQKEFVDNKAHKNIAFVDFGHSKLTVSIQKFTKTNFKILSQTWDKNLGARDFDVLVMNKYAEEFNTKFGADPRKSPKSVLRMLDAIEKCRKILSGISEAHLTIECLMEDEDLDVLIKRDDYEAMIMEQLNGFSDVCKRALAQSGI